ncbi:ARM repeat-containing protein [Trametes punicea]|nr:ARM repeat-containing protein [Trametes punicea]
MDVPFSSSGAMTRAHYALVRKVESSTIQAADQLLLAEVQTIRQQLGRSTLTLKQCKENLILLLYCAMSVSPGVRLDLEFALPHAINLAEAGQTIQDKRTGYLFCSEVMPPEHELQLMLVNSVRKDLESSAIPRICLALDTLIQSGSKDVIPAVRSSLHDLLSHNSAHVRRRALLAFNKLSEHDPEILREIVSKARKRLADAESVVVMAALTLCETLVKENVLPREKLHKDVAALLSAAWSQQPVPPHTQLLVRLIQALSTLNASTQDLRILLDIIRHYVRMDSSAYAIIHQCFRVVANSPVNDLLEAQNAAGSSFVKEIRQLLTDHDPNGLYLFVCCLASVEPKLWAGTSPEVPAVLEGWEVERVMKLLDCEDRLIRKQTLRTLWRVDQTIVESYYARALQGELPISSQQGSDEFLPRLLEILDVIAGDDGEAYAHQLKIVLKAVEGDGPLNKRPVLQEAVGEVLNRMHSGDSSWRSGCIGVLFTTLVDQNSEVGPTLITILTALLCEILGLSPISPVEILRGLSVRLSSYSVAVQDACLVAMLHISGACDEVPAEVNERVGDLQARSGRHIRRRCDQFISLSQSKDTLKRIIASASSTSLPDFVIALEKYEAEKQRTASGSPLTIPSSPVLKARSPEPTSLRTSPTPSKLRYAAYDPPRPTRRLRRLSSGSSRHSDDGSVRSTSQSRGYEDPMAMTLTPGELTLAAQTSDLRSISNGSPRSNLSPLPVVQILDEDAAAPDLIALDSPFMSEPQPSITSTLNVAEYDFETTWNALGSSTSRGWPPFEGDLKIVIYPEGTNTPSKEGLAAIRLKASDDDSCLWWLRCEDEQLRNLIKATLS